ncbi:MAG: hypothetical protein PWQ12_1942 [Clostridiales bacterium]|jgi:HAD superfamily hydrolase (TIGR01509 family)|nr:hypothetical protein [Clostridiales bacterium]
MKLDHNIEAIIFDLDGTLIDSMWIWKQIDIDFLEKRGIDFPEDLQKDIEGMSFTETAHYFIKRFKLTEPLDKIQAEWNDMARTFYRERIPMKAGAVEMIEYAVSKGIKLGIGTSNSRDLLQEVIGAHSIETHFQSIRTSCEVERGKPYPDIFLKVAEDLGVAPEKCLVFEDTHAGVLAAKRAGMKVIAVRDEISAPYEAEIRGDADAYIQSFEELFAV